ncbi:MAG: hypothetical protein NC242_06400 [Roseburia sp.]|nr:hypothetical protein [Roseburia sp.]
MEAILLLFWGYYKDKEGFAAGIPYTAGDGEARDGFQSYLCDGKLDFLNVLRRISDCGTRMSRKVRTEPRRRIAGGRVKGYKLSRTFRKTI